MNIDELCDAINEAKIVQFEDVQSAVSDMLFDLGKMITETDVLYYLFCEKTNAPYINPNMNAMIFSDEYFAEKYVDSRPEMHLSVKSVDLKNQYKFFCYLLQSGINFVDICSAKKSISLIVDKHIYKNLRGNNTASPELSKYLILTAQAVRTESEAVNNKRLINLLMANIISAVQDAIVLMPVHFETPISLRTLNGQIVQNIPADAVYTIQTMKDTNGNVMFPLFTNIFEFLNTNPKDTLCIATPASNYLNFVKRQIDAGFASGIICNSSSVGVLWNEDSINVFLDNISKQSN